jgi:hypothetical protein
MEQENNSKISKLYLASVLLFMLILPVISIVIDTGYNSGSSIFYIGKWFVFWAIGIRLLTAGLRQVIKPAKDILHIDSIESHIIVRELGFANICFGLAGVVSMYIPEWRTAAAFTGGLYMGIAGIQHIIKKPSTPNEMVAMVSDIFIFLVMAVYVGMMLF